MICLLTVQLTGRWDVNCNKNCGKEAEESLFMWKMIIMAKSFMDKCKKDKINAYAAQSAFFILLSLIPFLMVFSSLLRYTPITEETLIKICLLYTSDAADE